MSSFDADVFVIGGGIAGLACAAHLKRNSLNVRLFERSDHLGGVIRTLKEGGYRIETGPNSLFLHAEDPLFEYLSFLGLGESAIPAGETGKKRFVLRNGAPVPMPMSISEAFSTPLLSLGGKLRVVKELWVPPLEDQQDRESIAAFVSRRFGDEFLDSFIDPFIKGIYASSPGLLSLKATFPKLAGLERRYGSIIRGGIALKFQAKHPHPLVRTIFSFREGMGALPEALATYLSSDAGTNSEVVGCAPIEGGYRISALYDEEIYYLTARQIVIAGSATRTSELLSEICPGATAPLNEIPYAPVAVVYMGFRRKDVAHPLDGFGLLVPETEKRKILGVLFSSSLFPERAPKDHVLLTVYVGGMMRPKLAFSFDEDLLETVQSEIRSILGASGAPDFLRIQRWEEAIAQFTMGHIDRVEKVRQSLPETLHLAGSYLDGVSVSQSFSSGISAATAVLKNAAHP